MIAPDDFPQRVVRATRQLMDYFAPEPARSVDARLLDLADVQNIVAAFRKSVVAIDTHGKTCQRVLRYLDSVDTELVSIRRNLRDLNSGHQRVSTWQEAARRAGTVVRWMGRAHDLIALQPLGRDGRELLDRCKTTLGFCRVNAEWLDIAARHAKREMDDRLANVVSRIRNDRALADHV